MSLLTKEEIFNVDDLKTKEIYISAWGGSVRIRSITALERDRFESILFESDAKERRENRRATLVAMAIVDEKNNLMFSPKDIKKLGGKNARALDDILDEIMEMNSMKEEDLDRVVENLAETPTAEEDGE